ncbi:DUF4352 domain-containing protein [Pseudonocardia parietis]|uniref:DUF4352 domain-containing protein n=1 Tax=Pseudonocardia parietis TaxID=570936 RepID=A0ABS4W2R9_9PSEU|nr:DUF4352 domain-containing protein [Pseudonocardia parietis]MBP2370238.1 hypothetical protein [Pseudonocardia parietis]
MPDGQRQSTEHQPHYQPQPRNGFGITALVLALIGLVFGLIPFTGFIALILGALAVLFGLLGWARTRRGTANNPKMSAVGTALGAIAVALGIWGIVIVFQATDQLVQDLDQAVNPAPGVIAPVDGAAPVEAPVEDASIPEAPAGQTVSVGPLDVTAADLKLLTDEFTDDQLCSAVEYRNVGNGTASYNSFDWKLQDPNGVIHSSGIPFGAESPLNSGQLAPGGTVSGDVCFDASASGAYQLQYASSMMAATPQATWALQH